jgi:hypothetical protein
MIDINAPQPPEAGQSDATELAKAYPAQDLREPGWKCPLCGKRNRVTDAYCTECDK